MNVETDPIKEPFAGKTKGGGEFSKLTTADVRIE
jgi:hypothetical protein